MQLVLCDDNRILCEALASAMEARGHKVVAITGNAADGLAAVNTHRPDIMLVDLRVPACAEGVDTNGAGALKAVEAMRQDHSDTALLVLSGLRNRAVWSAAMEIGAAGFLWKNQDLGQIAAALDVIEVGGMVSDPMVLNWMSSCVPSHQQTSRVYALTPREKEVLRRIVDGQSTRQMASEMSIAADTLRTYVKNVLAKLGAHSRLQAAALAAREDLVSELSALPDGATWATLWDGETGAAPTWRRPGHGRLGYRVMLV
jgi:two-component system nitrate/nitrite response regulator NarL